MLIVQICSLDLITKNLKVNSPENENVLLNRPFTMDANSISHTCFDYHHSNRLLPNQVTIHPTNAICTVYIILYTYTIFEKETFSSEKCEA